MVLSSSIRCLFLSIFIVVSSGFPIDSLETENHQSVNETFRSAQQLYELKKMIATRLQQINKPAIKTIQSPDGDIIDCVLTHKQPAFDHPLLKGEKPMDPPESLRRQNQIGNMSYHFQLWSSSGESCPDGTIPIRRVTEEDMLRAHSIDSFGRKFLFPAPHEYAVVSEKKDNIYGAKGLINVWNPYVESESEYSLARMRVLGGTPGNDLNDIQVGWQVYQRLYGDYRTRFYMYWTGDDFKSTGCYNLLCPGFVQTNKKFVVGGTISGVSTYNGEQYSMPLSVVKDKQTGNWWVGFGYGRENLIGYWPSKLFTHLKNAANEVHFGGEIVNSKALWSHTSTVMGSGNFPEEGFRKAAYIRNMQTIDVDYKLNPLKNAMYSATNSKCYRIIKGNTNPKWGYHVYFGGYGKGKNCP